MVFEQLSDASPLKPEIIEGGLDIVVVRELTGGIYFGEKGVKESTPLGPAAYDVEQYAEEEVRRIAKVAFDMAVKRRRKVTSVDKANVLESSRLWRRVVAEVAKEYPDVELDNLYVDNAAMQLVRNPKQFDVLVTSNIFGDILSDEASQITGSSACCLRPAYLRAISACMSLSTVLRRTSREKIWQTLSPPYFPPL